MPDGPVYFDAPPPEGSVALMLSMELASPWCEPQPSMYVVLPEGNGSAATPLLEWKELHMPADEDVDEAEPSDSALNAARDLVLAADADAAGAVSAALQPD